MHTRRKELQVEFILGDRTNVLSIKHHTCIESLKRCECFSTKRENSDGIPCICPNNPLFQMIQSQSIRPGADFHIIEHNVSTSSTHGCSLDSGVSSIPVSPEEDPWSRNAKATLIIDHWRFVFMRKSNNIQNAQFIFFYRATKNDFWTIKPSQNNSSATCNRQCYHCELKNKGNASTMLLKLYALTQTVAVMTV